MRQVRHSRVERAGRPTRGCVGSAPPGARRKAAGSSCMRSFSLLRAPAPAAAGFFGGRGLLVEGAALATALALTMVDSAPCAAADDAL